MPTWNPAWKPRVQGARQRSSILVNILRFEGYEQRVVSGIDPLDDAFSLTFRDTTAVIEAIDAFLRARVTSNGGLESFDYVDESTSLDPAYKVVAESWDRMPARGSLDQIVVQFRKVPPEWP